MERDKEWDQYVDAILAAYQDGNVHHINDVIAERIPELTNQGVREKFVRYLVAWDLLKPEANWFRYTIGVLGAHVVRNEKSWNRYLLKKSWKKFAVAALTIIAGAAIGAFFTDRCTQAENVVPPVQKEQQTKIDSASTKPAELPDSVVAD